MFFSLLVVRFICLFQRLFGCKMSLLPLGCSDCADNIADDDDDDDNDDVLFLVPFMNLCCGCLVLCEHEAPTVLIFIPA